jgi:hypothetical protein
MGFWGCYYDPNVVVNLPWPNFATQKRKQKNGADNIKKRIILKKNKNLDSSNFEFKKKNN